MQSPSCLALQRVSEAPLIGQPQACVRCIGLQLWAVAYLDRTTAPAEVPLEWLKQNP